MYKINDAVPIKHEYYWFDRLESEEIVFCRVVALGNGVAFVKARDGLMKTNIKPCGRFVWKWFPWPRWKFIPN